MSFCCAGEIMFLETSTWVMMFQYSKLFCSRIPKRFQMCSIQWAYQVVSFYFNVFLSPSAFLFKFKRQSEECICVMDGLIAICLVSEFCCKDRR